MAAKKRKPVAPQSASIPVPGWLVTEPVIHPKLKTLYDTLVMVTVWSREIARTYNNLLDLKGAYGLPKDDDWPGSRAIEIRRHQHEAWEKAELARAKENGEQVSCCYVEPEWTIAIREWTRVYCEWCKTNVAAKGGAGAKAVSSIMDEGENRPIRRWTVELTVDLDSLFGLLHPIRLGEDGMGVIRAGVPPFPAEVIPLAQKINRRLAEMRAIPADRSVASPAVKVGEGMKWEEVRAELLQWRADGVLFTSYRNIGEMLGCSHKTVSKAINMDTGLKAWMAMSASSATAPRFARLTPIHQDRLAQSKERDPADSVAHGECDAIFARLIDQASKVDRIKLQAMSQDQRDELVELFKEQQADKDSSPHR